LALRFVNKNQGIFLGMDYMEGVRIHIN